MTSALAAFNSATYGGVYRSDDIDFTDLTTQPTWTRMATTGLANTLVKVAQYHPSDPYNDIYLQLDNEDVYHWNGTSWTKVLDLASACTLAGITNVDMRVGDIAIDVSTPGTIYYPMLKLTVVAELLKSTDYGATWMSSVVISGSGGNVPNGYPHVRGHGLNVIYNLTMTVTQRFYFSTNGGATWANRAAGHARAFKQDTLNPAQAYCVVSGSDLNLARIIITGSTTLQNGYYLMNTRADGMWLDPVTSGHQRILRNYNNDIQLFATNDSWATMVDTTPDVLYSATDIYAALAAALEDHDMMLAGFTDTGVEDGKQRIYGFYGETPSAWYGLSGTNYNTAPYTNAIPCVGAMYIAVEGIWVGQSPAAKGVYTFADEQGDVNDVPTYTGLGIPMFGSAASFRDKDADNDGLTPPTVLAKYHAQDIHEETPQRHNLWPVTAGNFQVSDGTKWIEATPTDPSATVAITNVSNPPTEAQLITAFGPADTFASEGHVGVLNDNALGVNEYAVFSDGGHYWYIPLAKATGTTASIAVDSTATIAGTTAWFGRATMERLANGTWVLVYEEGSVHWVNDDVVHIRFSDDQGATWTAEDTDLDGNAVTGFPAYPTGAAPADVYGPGDTYIWQAPNGDLWLHTWKVDYDGDLMAGCWHMKSTDNGSTWGAWSQINYVGLDAATDNLTMLTEQHFIIGTTIYMAGRIHQDATEAVVKNAFFTSIDNGTTWTYVSDMSSFVNNTIEVAMEYLGNSNILAYFRATANDKSYKATSTDLGATWSALTDITATLNTIGRNRLYTRAHLKGYDNWWTDSVLIMVGFVFTTPGAATPRRNAVWVSQDQGATWVGPTYVAAQTEDAGYGDALWNTTTNKLINISYQGLYTNADIQQYTITVSGV